jgi:hypothetical protein
MKQNNQIARNTIKPLNSKRKLIPIINKVFNGATANILNRPTPWRHYKSCVVACQAALAIGSVH